MFINVIYLKVNLNGFNGCFSNNNNNNIVPTFPQVNGSILSLSNILIISTSNNRRQTNTRLSDIQPDILFKNVTDKVIKHAY